MDLILSQFWSVWPKSGTKKLCCGFYLYQQTQFCASNFFFVSFTSTSQTLFQTIILCSLKENQRTKLEKKAKNLIPGPMLVQIGGPIFFFFFFLLKSISTSWKHYFKRSLYAISRKTNELNLKNEKKKIIISA